MKDVVWQKATGGTTSRNSFKKKIYIGKPILRHGYTTSGRHGVGKTGAEIAELQGFQTGGEIYSGELQKKAKKAREGGKYLSRRQRDSRKNKKKKGEKKRRRQDRNRFASVVSHSSYRRTKNSVTKEVLTQKKT